MGLQEYSDQELLSALTERIPTREGKPWRAFGISDEWMAMAILICDTDITTESLSRKVGVTRRTLYNWRHVGQLLRSRNSYGPRSL